MLIPKIDFQYWYIVNNELSKTREKGLYITRHHAVATQIWNKYLNENLRLAYFTQFNEDDKIKVEYERIKNLTYEELENEILRNTSEIIQDSFRNKESILKTFDLIQIWGGKPGGNNIYNRNGFDRLNNTEWMKVYIDGAKEASLGNHESYQILKSIKHLEIPFASKHVNFYSRHLKMNSLIIIDEKISHCFKIEDPKTLSIKEIETINDLCKTTAANIGYEPWQIEKALFSFHLRYFKAKSLKNENYLNDLDTTNVKEIYVWYEENKKNSSLKESKVKSISKVINRNKKNIKYIIKKNEYFIAKDGCIFIINSAIERCLIPSYKIDKLKYLKINDNIFYKFNGGIDSFKTI
jgi:hypothetical protein